MNRTPWSFLIVAAAIAGLVPSACSQPAADPPQLADCVGTPDASCAPVRGPPGGGVTVHGDASTELDAPLTEDLEGGSCGMADMLIASNANPAFPACAQCINAAPGSGAPACCLADSACDSGCVAILQCVLQQQCNGNAACVETCEAKLLATPSSVGNYDSFGSCLSQNCPTQCPTLPPGMAATGDI